MHLSMANIFISIIVANPSHKKYATTITDEMENSVKRGTGIAKRNAGVCGNQKNG